MQRDAVPRPHRHRRGLVRRAGLVARRPARARAHDPRLRRLAAPGPDPRRSRASVRQAAARRRRPDQSLGPSRPRVVAALEARRRRARQVQPRPEAQRDVRRREHRRDARDRIDHALVRALLGRLAHRCDVRARLVRARDRAVGRRTHRVRARRIRTRCGAWCAAGCRGSGRRRSARAGSPRSTPSQATAAMRSATSSHARSSGTPNSGRRHARCPPARSCTVAPGIAAAISRCSCGCTRAVLGRADDGRRHVDLADPAAGVVGAQRLPGLDDHAPVVAPELGRDPRGQTARVVAAERDHGDGRRERGEPRAARESAASTSGTRGGRSRSGRTRAPSRRAPDPRRGRGAGARGAARSVRPSSTRRR